MFYPYDGAMPRLPRLRLLLPWLKEAESDSGSSAVGPKLFLATITD